MATAKIQGNPLGSGSVTLAAPNTNSDFTLNMPAANGTLLNTGSTGVITPSMFAANAISTNTYTSALGVTKFSFGNAAPAAQPLYASFTLSEAEAPLGSYVVLQQFITSGNSSGQQYCGFQQGTESGARPGVASYITGWFFADKRIAMFYIGSAGDRTFNVIHGTITATNNNDSRNIYYMGYIKVTQ